MFSNHELGHVCGVEHLAHVSSSRVELSQVLAGPGQFDMLTARLERHELSVSPARRDYEIRSDGR